MSPGSTAATRSSGARRGGGGASHGAPIEFPTAERSMPAFMREVGDVHRELYAKHGELYGENIARKIERCLAVTDAEYEAAQQARREHAERAQAALAGSTCCSTPTLGFVAPAADVDETGRYGRGDALHVPVQRARLAGARAAVRRAEDGLPASVQIAGRQGCGCACPGSGT